MKKENKRIEFKTSRTAEMTCVTRAASYFENSPYYKSDDYIAPKLLPSFMLPFIKMSFVRNIYKNRMSPKGIYEYVIGRTKYIDSVFKKSLNNGFKQVVIFGAGFDSRGLRFIDDNSDVQVFELDVPITQNAKIDQLKKRGISIPENIHFVAIDFNKELVIEKLNQYSFNENAKTLFLLEGLLMYLDADSVNSTFKIISDNAISGSEVVFDFVYASVLRKEKKYYGEEDIYKYVFNAGESWIFGIEEDAIESFLKQFNFKVKEMISSAKLEELYFKNEDGKVKEE